MTSDLHEFTTHPHSRPPAGTGEVPGPGDKSLGWPGRGSPKCVLSGHSASPFRVLPLHLTSCSRTRGPFLAELKHPSLDSGKSLLCRANQLGRKARKTKDLTGMKPLLPSGELGYGGREAAPAAGKGGGGPGKGNIWGLDHMPKLCLVLLSSSALEVIL